MQIYFIRHGEPDYTEKDDYKRQLTDKGKQQAMELVSCFNSVNVDGVFSSPYLRAIQTVNPLAKSKGVSVQLIDGLRERKSAGYIVPESQFRGFAQRQWNDMKFRYEGGESILDVQKRYTKAVSVMLSEAEKNGQSILIAGCHITGLCAYLSQFGIIVSYSDFKSVCQYKPWIVRATYLHRKCEEISLLGGLSELSRI